MFISFAVKVPMPPFHTWLPDAHVQAPTAGSVMLAGILLKLGGYAFLRISLPMLPAASAAFSEYVLWISSFAVVYASLVAYVQTDMKKMIAYSSVAHMGYVTGGIFSFTEKGINGAIFQMISHGLISAALFLAVGILYDRHHTKEISKYGGVAASMPILATLFMIAMLGSVGLPGLSGFVGEFLLMFSFLFVSKVAFIFASLGFLISITYSFWLYNRISFLLPFHIFVFSDLSKREFFVTIPFIVMIFFFGLYPSCILNILEPISLFILNFNPFLFFSSLNSPEVLKKRSMI